MIANTETSELQRAMAHIRQKRHIRLQGLHHQAERMVDWREHVKSAPLTAILASSIMGFMLIRTALPKHKAKAAVEEQPIAAREETTSNKLVRSALSLLMPLFYSAAKNYAVQQLGQISKSFGGHEVNRLPEASRNGGIS